MITKDSFHFALAGITTTLMVAVLSVAQHGTVAKPPELHAVAAKGHSVAVAAPGRKTESPIPPVLLKQKMKESQRRIAADLLSYFPAECQNTLQNFYVRENGSDRRGLAGKDTVIIDGRLSDAEFRAVLVHELLGHVMDLGCLQGTPQSGESAYRDGDTVFYRNDPSVAFYQLSWSTERTRNPQAKPDDFVSGYAYQADAFEDLAESVAYAYLHPDLFAKRARENPVLARKLAWVQTEIFNGKDLPGRSTAPLDTKSIPWDVTKLPYSLLAQVGR